MTKASRAVIWSPEAAQDLLDIWRHLAMVASTTIADNHLRDIDRAVSMLIDWSLAGRARDELVLGLRSVPVHPSIILYRVRENSPQIVRVIDSRRDINEILAD